MLSTLSQNTADLSKDLSQKTLLQKKLRHTDNRERILSYFLKEERALTHGDLEVQFPEMDRVTIYRTLQTFHKKGILHRILDEQGTAQYALCDSEYCDDHHHEGDNHLHFTCEQCKQTFCLTQVSTPPVSLPKGYSLSSINLTAKGICKNCYKP